MDTVLLIAILLLNVIISVWNCYAVGAMWKDTMTLGSGFDKVLLWSGVIQSGVGFSMPILVALAYGSVAFLTSGTDPSLTPTEGAQMMQAIFSLWYVAVIFPILGSGLAIWVHSLRVAYERRDFASIATAGWNSFAQISNTVSVFNNLGGALGNVGELFSGALKGDGDGKWKMIIFVILLVVVSLTAGFMLTFGLVRYFMKSSDSRIERHMVDLQKRAHA